MLAQFRSQFVPLKVITQGEQWAKWATRYREDVRRYVMLGTPNGGIDVSFAYPNLNYYILLNKTPAPLSWTKIGA